MTDTYTFRQLGVYDLVVHQDTQAVTAEGIVEHTAKQDHLDLEKRFTWEEWWAAQTEWAEEPA
jgi:hypothetical protein